MMNEEEKRKIEAELLAAFRVAPLPAERITMANSPESKAQRITESLPAMSRAWSGLHPGRVEPA